jgi:hypothetical protein
MAGELIAELASILATTIQDRVEYGEYQLQFCSPDLSHSFQDRFSVE